MLKFSFQEVTNKKWNGMKFSEHYEKTKNQRQHKQM